MARVFTINLPATSFVPAAGAGGAKFVNHAVSNIPRTALAFSDSTRDYSAISQAFEWPDEYADGTVKAVIYWYGRNVSNAVIWEISFEAETPGAAGATVDMEDGASSFSTVNQQSSTANGTQGEVTAQEVTLSNLDSVAKADHVRIKLTRNADDGSDNFSGDAYVPLVVIYEAS